MPVVKKMVESCIYRLRHLLLVTVFLSLSSISSATETYPLVTDEFQPYSYQEDEKAKGVVTEIVQQIFKRMGKTIEINFLPATRAQIEAGKGNYLAFFPLTKTPLRNSLFYFSVPLGSFKDVFFKRKGDQISWKKLSDLSKYRIGATSGYSYPGGMMEAIEKKKLNVELIYAQKPNVLHLKKLAKNRLDLVICEQRLCEFIIRKGNPHYSNIDFINRSIGKIRPYYVAFSKEWPQAKKWRDRFNLELSSFLRENKAQTIFKKYHYKNYYYE